MTKGKNGQSKEKKIKQEHPFGPPEARAKGFTFPSPNPTLFVQAGKTAEKLPKNLQDVFAAVGRHANGTPLKTLKVTGLGTKTLHWLVRQLAKHEFIRCKAEEKAEPKKAAKKEEK